jgi:hypothetical protein
VQPLWTAGKITAGIRRHRRCPRAGPPAPTDCEVVSGRNPLLQRAPRPRGARRRRGLGRRVRDGGREGTRATGAERSRHHGARHLEPRSADRRRCCASRRQGDDLGRCGVRATLDAAVDKDTRLEPTPLPPSSSTRRNLRNPPGPR